MIDICCVEVVRAPVFFFLNIIIYFFTYLLIYLFTYLFWTFYFWSKIPIARNLRADDMLPPVNMDQPIGLLNSFTQPDYPAFNARLNHKISVRICQGAFVLHDTMK
jgi:hypothetical protein